MNPNEFIEKTGNVQQISMQKLKPWMIRGLILLQVFLNLYFFVYCKSSDKGISIAERDIEYLERDVTREAKFTWEMSKDIERLKEQIKLNEENSKRMNNLINGHHYQIKHIWYTMGLPIEELPFHSIDLQIRSTDSLPSAS